MIFTLSTKVGLIGEHDSLQGTNTYRTKYTKTRVFNRLATLNKKVFALCNRCYGDMRSGSVDDDETHNSIKASLNLLNQFFPLHFFFNQLHG